MIPGASGTPAATLDRRSRTLLIFCAVAVAFAAVDTYVVVLALPDMMGSVGIGVEELQRAAPIVSGFLLGYVAILPLIGRVADLRGSVPVLASSLITFAVGSVITAVAYDLASMVVGRFLQGVGGGGLVPATMALVAALYPVERRGLPLGLISAVQEFGSVLGPLFGAAVLAFSSWRTIFAINVAVALLLWVVVRVLRASDPTEPEVPAVPAGDRGRVDLLGLLALAVAVVAAAFTINPPHDLYVDITYGQWFTPVVDDAGRWFWPVGLIAAGAFAVFCLRCVFARRPLIDVRGWVAQLREADLAGALLLAVALGGIVLAFATADPEVAVFSPQGHWFLAGSAVAAALLVVHLRRAEAPIIPRGALRAMPAWGSLVVSLLIGWALIAALVDIPLFARTTVYPDSQFDAALVLLRFLIALPIGAVVGGWLVRHVSAGLITSVGMLCAAAGFWLMSTWDATSLESFGANVPLVLSGLGFGLALAPVNAAMLAATRDDTHGLASALVVVARMTGMLVGISALTTWGLRQFHDARVHHPPAICDEEGAKAAKACVKALGIVQEQAVFQGAAVVAGIAAVLALIVFRGAATRGLKSGQFLTPLG